MAGEPYPEIEPVTCIGYGTDEWWELGRRRIEGVALWFWQYDGWWEEWEAAERDGRAIADPPIGTLRQ